MILLIRYLMNFGLVRMNETSSRYALLFMVARERTKLPPSVLTLCEDAANDLYLSIASIWEIQIKLQLGKLKLSYPLSEIIEREQRGNAVKILHILPPHIYQLAM